MIELFLFQNDSSLLTNEISVKKIELKTSFKNFSKKIPLYSQKKVHAYIVPRLSTS
jgi:hypothetical protein